MRELQELRDQLHGLLQERRAIHEKAAADGDRVLTRAEQERWDQIDAEQADIQNRIPEAEDRANRYEMVSASRAKWGSLQVGNSDGAWNYTTTDVAQMGKVEARDKARRRIDDAGHLGSHQGDHATALVDGKVSHRNVDPDYVARLILLTESPEYRSAFRQLMSSPMPLLSTREADAVRAVQELRAMAEGSGSTGGFGVPALIDPTIILTGQQSLNPFLGIARVVTITTKDWKGVSSTGSTWSWDAEAAEVSDDSATLVQPTITAAAARGFIPYSIEVEQDYPHFATEMAVLLSEGYQELTAEAFAVGDGSGKPRGIFHKLDANTNVEVVVTTDGAFGKPDISKVWTALPDRAKANATWVMSESVKEVIRGFDGDDYAGRTVNLTGASFRIRERDVAASGFAPAFTGTTGAANILVVGDFQKYVIAQRAGMTLEHVPHLIGTTNNRPTGQRGLFAWARVGADSVDDTAFRLLQNQ